MLSSVWEFTKRHKGKIITAGVVVGGLVAYKTTHKRPTLERPHEHVDYSSQARRHYIFDTIQRSCDQSITDLIPSLTEQIEARFDVDGLTERLKENPNMGKEEKVKTWEQIKRNTFALIVSVAYSFSILTITLKSQMSILAADNCSNLESTKTTTSWESYLPEAVRNMIRPEPGANENVGDANVEVANRRIFLQCIQYFTIKALPQLLDIINDRVSLEVDQWPLTELTTMDNVRELFDRISKHLAIENILPKLVAPLDQSQDSNNDSVIVLLQRLTDSLETAVNSNLLNNLTDFYFSAVVKVVPEKSQPVVKILPALRDSYSVIKSTAYDSPLLNSLYSSDVHHFAINVFNFCLK